MPEIYNDRVVRQFALMTLVWGVAGMAVGVLIAAQLLWPALNTGSPGLTFGRLQTVHADTAVLAFGGSALCGASYYILQRTCRVRLCSDRLAAVTFWGWQLFGVTAVIVPLSGISSGLKSAGFEWPGDLLMAIVWIAYAIVFLGTLAKRQVPDVHIANWFFVACIIAMAVSHLVDNIGGPEFLLTGGFLGVMYYVVPEQAGRPIYSRRLAIVHFWSLVAACILAGPPHFQDASLPEWLQTLRVALSLLLVAPALGGMMNGILTITAVGEWRSDPILKFMAAALLFYGISVLEEAMLSITSVRDVLDYTDLTTTHTQALGWAAMLSMGAYYVLVSRFYAINRLQSTQLIEVHFWFTVLGVVLYVVSMWGAGLVQGLMWRSLDAAGTPAYSATDVLLAAYPFHVVRLVGGLLIFAGLLLMARNIIGTIRRRTSVPGVPVLE